MPKSEAFAVATKSLQKNGILKPGTQDLTAKGAKRDKMTAAERAKDRAAKKAGRKPSDYTYNQLNNTARVKK